MEKYLSLIIPAYNEEKRLAASLAKAMEYLARMEYSSEIVVVDDGSRDRTIEVAHSCSDSIIVLPQPRNMGKGAAVRRGMLESNGRFRVFTDADFSTPIKELEKILPRLEGGADVCIGSRAMDPSMIKEHQPFYREFMGKTFNKFVSTLFFKGIKDTQCGFKGFSASAAERIFSISRIDGFSFDVEAIYLAKRLGLHVDQVPVEWYNDDRSTVNPITDSARMFLELLKIRKLHKSIY